jgi:hypothetical protein
VSILFADQLLDFFSVLVRELLSFAEAKISSSAAASFSVLL